jgi:hypothetical protein
MSHHLFNSRIDIAGDLPEFSEQQIKNEPMLFNCDLKTASELGGPLTKAFLEALPNYWKWSDDMVIDSRVHMLKKGWFPCIPGFHHDDVPRERSDGQPNYIKPSYHSEHVLALIGDCCPTQFATGLSTFPEVPLGEKYYKVWHPLVVEKIKKGELQSVNAPSNKLVYFDWQTWHQGVPAIKDGWRWFIRASRNTDRKPTNELRRQVQVYLDMPMEGW